MFSKICTKIKNDYSLFIVFSLPLLFYIINNDWVYPNVLSMFLDEWYYIGHIFHYPDNYDIRYFGSRLPHIFLGKLFFSTINVSLAPIVYKLFLLYSVTIGLFYFMRILSSEKAAALTTCIMFLFYPFIAELSTYYVSSSIIFFIIVSIGALVACKNGLSIPLKLIIAGFFWVSAFFTNLWSIFFIPSIILIYLHVIESLDIKYLIKSALFFLVGCSLGTLVFGLISFYYTHSFYFLIHMFSYFTSNVYVNESKSAYLQSMSISPFLLTTGFIIICCLGEAFKKGEKKREIFKPLIYCQAIFLVLFYLIYQLSTGTYPTATPYYFNYVFIFCLIALSIQFKPVVNKLSPIHYSIVILFTISIALFGFTYYWTIQQYLEKFFHNNFFGYHSYLEVPGIHIIGVLIIFSLFIYSAILFCYLFYQKKMKSSLWFSLLLISILFTSSILFPLAPSYASIFPSEINNHEPFMAVMDTDTYISNFTNDPCFFYSMSDSNLSQIYSCVHALHLNENMVSGTFRSTDGNPDFPFNNYQNYKALARDLFSNTEGYLVHMHNGSDISFQNYLQEVSYFEKVTFISQKDIAYNENIFFTDIYHFIINQSRIFPSVYFTQIGKKEKERIISPLNTTGFLVYGPYVELTPGNYLITFSMEGESSKNDTVLGFVDIFDIYTEKIINKSEYSADMGMRKESISIPFTAVKGKPYEFRVYKSSEGVFNVNNIQVSKINDLTNLQKVKTA